MVAKQQVSGGEGIPSQDVEGFDVELIGFDPTGLSASVARDKASVAYGRLSGDFLRAKEDSPERNRIRISLQQLLGFLKKD